MADDLPKNPFRIVDVPNRDTVLAWTGIHPVPHTQEDVDELFDIGVMIYQLPKTGRGL